MRVSSPFSASPFSSQASADRLSPEELQTGRRPSGLIRFLVALGTGALIVLVIILITGGFVLDAGPLHLSARRWQGPLVLALAAWVAARATASALGRPTELRLACAEVAAFVDRHGLAIALLFGAAAGGVGVAYGTYAASGADASGYVSEAEALASGALVLDEPLARALDVPNATLVLSPLGYRPGRVVGEIVPTYPSGLPLVMALARRFLPADPLAPFLVVPLFGGLTVLATYLLGVLLHSRTAGVVGSALMATSPIFLFQIVQAMSDVPAAAWWTLAFVFARSTFPSAPLAAGATVGLAVLTRPNLAPVGLVVALCLAMRSAEADAHADRRSRVSRLLHFLAGSTPAAGALLLVQWRLYGAPFLSGYGAADTLFSAANIVPNLRGYGARLAQGEPGALILLVGAALVTLLRGRHLPATARPHELRASAALALTVAAAVTACYLPYAVFSEWFYLRFLLPALPAVFVAIGAMVTIATRAIPRPARGIVLALLVTAVCSANVRVAQREQAFNLHSYEARYRVAGQYLEAALPRDAVIVSVQQSGSARYYSRLPIARWDLLGNDLDATLAALEHAGRRPFLLVEDWEQPDVRARFPASPIARLDWPPRVEVTGTTKVRLFDPRDRQSSGGYAIDRLR